MLNSTFCESMLRTLFSLSYFLYHGNYYSIYVFCYQDMKWCDLASGKHMFFLQGWLWCKCIFCWEPYHTHACAWETAAQCTLPSVENTGLERKWGGLLISVTTHFITLYQSLEGFIHPLFCINEAFFFPRDLTTAPMNVSSLWLLWA